MPVGIQPCLKNAAKRAARSRRKLHLVFFHHAGASIALPYWWDAIFTPMSQLLSGTVASRNKYAAAGAVAPGMLDFLYPRGTKALIRRLSNTLPYEARSYSSTAAQRQNLASRTAIDPSPASQSPAVAQSTPVESEGGSEPLEESLSNLKANLLSLDWTDQTSGWQNKLGAQANSRQYIELYEAASCPIGEDTDYDQAWIKFSNLAGSDMTIHTRIQMANFLSFSGREDDGTRLLLLTDGPQFDKRFTFWRAIVIHVFAGNVEKAGEIHQAAKLLGADGYIGSDLLLAHAIRAQNWSIALQVSTAIFGSLTPNSDKQLIQTTIEELWAMARQLDCLNTRAADFITYAYKELDADYFIIKAFIRHFLFAIFSKLPPPLASFARLLELLRNYRLDRKSALQYVMHNVTEAIQNKRISMSDRVFEMILAIWKAYRRHYAKGEIEAPLLRRFLALLTTHQSTLTIPMEQRHALISDVITTIVADHVEVPYSIMALLMGSYARVGNVEMVHTLNQNMKPPIAAIALSRGFMRVNDADQMRLTALIHVHGVRRDPAAARRATLEIAHLVYPARKAQWLWNELLKAYGLARDFGGMLKLFLHEMPARQIQPTKASIEIVLKDCGWVGNVPAVRALVQYAKQNNIQFTERMVRQLAIAHASAGDHAAAGDIINMLQQANMRTDFPLQMKLWRAQLSAAARNKDFKQAYNIHHKMMSLGHQLTPADFSPMVALLTTRKAVDEAARLIFETMPAKGVRITPLILAMLLRGYYFVQRYEDVVRIFDMIVSIGEGVDVTAKVYRLAAFCAIHREHPLRDDYVLTTLNKSLQHAHNDTFILKDWSDIWSGTPLDLYFYTPIELFGEVKAWDVLNYLQRLYIAKSTAGPSLGILKAFMKVHALAGNHDEVERLWLRSLDMLSKHICDMSTALSQFSIANEPQSSHPPEHHLASDAQQPNYPELADSSILTSFVQDSQSNVSRQLISSTSDVRSLISFSLMPYLSSLTERHKYDQMLSTINHLQSLGFVLTSKVWNSFVASLCRSSEPRFVLAAFRAAEVHFAAQAIDYDLTQFNLPPTEREQSSMNIRKREKLSVSYPFARTMNILKEASLAAEDVAITSDLSGFGRINGVISLASILEEAAPSIYSIIKKWQVPIRANRSIEYYNGQQNYRAAMAAEARAAALTKLSSKDQNDRLTKFGDNQLLSFTYLLHGDSSHQTALSDKTTSMGDLPQHPLPGTNIEVQYPLLDTSTRVKDKIRQAFKYNPIEDSHTYQTPRDHDSENITAEKPMGSGPSLERLMNCLRPASSSASLSFSASSSSSVSSSSSSSSSLKH